MNVEKARKATKRKFKPLWTFNDAVITLLYEKYGLGCIGILTDIQYEEFMYYYIGSTVTSLVMQSACVRHVITKGATGLPHHSKEQRKAVKLYNDIPKEQLIFAVEVIMNGVSDKQKLENYNRAMEEVRLREIEEKEEQIEKEKERLKKQQKEKDSKLLKGKISINDYNNKVNIKNSRFKIGDRVSHNNFGEAIVINIKGNIIHIKPLSNKKNTEPKRVVDIKLKKII